MTLDPAAALAAPVAPMEARLAADLPQGSGWQYEPKWDGFRVIAVARGDAVALWSRSGKPLGRYFPELVALLAAIGGPGFIVDGEIVVPVGDRLSFGALQARLHPAASRIARLTAETPAQLILFDALHLDGRDLSEAPLSERRAALEGFHRRSGNASLRLSPCSTDVAAARAWLREAGGSLDGVVAKRRDLAYCGGERTMAKVKQVRTADCVVGGFRGTADGAGIASLLLGLYDAAGRLDHVGFASGIAAAERPRLLARLAPLVDGPGFTGKAPGGPSRWTRGRSAEWSPLRPECVVEVGYDQVTDARFRHGTKVLRWRPDKAPGQCTMDQLARETSPAELEAIVARSGR